MKAAALAVGGVLVGGAAFQALPREHRIATFATSLEGRARSQRHNASLALSRLVHVTIGPSEVFSFNKRVGTFSRDAGYRKAPVSYNGQLINDWGGGVCQTSTTLYNAALLSGMKILERHRHRFAPSYVPPGRDAAVAFSNIDLRFQNPYAFPVRIEGRLDGDALQIELVADRDIPVRPTVIEKVRETRAPAQVRFGEGRMSKVRCTGKSGYEVAVFRITGNRKELVSADTYPAMSRIVERR